MGENVVYVAGRNGKDLPNIGQQQQTNKSKIAFNGKIIVVSGASLRLCGSLYGGAA